MVIDKISMIAPAKKMRHFFFPSASLFELWINIIHRCQKHQYNHASGSVSNFFSFPFISSF